MHRLFIGGKDAEGNSFVIGIIYPAVGEEVVLAPDCGIPPTMEESIEIVFAVNGLNVLTSNGRKLGRADGPKITFTGRRFADFGTTQKARRICLATIWN